LCLERSERNGHNDGGYEENQSDARFAGTVLKGSAIKRQDPGAEKLREFNNTGIQSADNRESVGFLYGRNKAAIKALLR